MGKRMRKKNKKGSRKPYRTQDSEEDMQDLHDNNLSPLFRTPTYSAKDTLKQSVKASETPNTQSTNFEYIPDATKQKSLDDKVTVEQGKQEPYHTITISEYKSQPKKTYNPKTPSTTPQYIPNDKESLDDKITASKPTEPVKQKPYHTEPKSEKKTTVQAPIETPKPEYIQNNTKENIDDKITASKPKSQGTRYGVISDIHGNLESFYRIVKKMQSDGIDAFILNGDIGSSPLETYHIINHVAKTGKKVLVSTGDHETPLIYHSMIDLCKQNYDNITDTTREGMGLIKKDNHSLKFVPGSYSGGLFELNKEGRKGAYIKFQEGDDIIMQKLSEEQYKRLLNMPQLEKVIHYFVDIEDIGKDIKSPESTVVFSHSPQKFDRPDSPDFADYIMEYAFDGKSQDYQRTGVLLPSIWLDMLQNNGMEIVSYDKHNGDKEHLAKILSQYAEQKKDMVYVQRKENAGFSALNSIYDSLGLQKIVSGHIHEAGHNAERLEGIPAPESEYLDSLYLNAGCSDFGHASIISVDGNKIKYDKVNIE